MSMIKTGQVVEKSVFHKLWAVPKYGQLHCSGSDVEPSIHVYHNEIES